MKQIALSALLIPALLAFSTAPSASAQTADVHAELSIQELVEAGIIKVSELPEPNPPAGDPSEVQALSLPGQAAASALGGGCYTACGSASLSSQFCGPGLVAELTISGPVSACYLNNIVCKTFCDGPVASCKGFTTC